MRACISFSSSSSSFPKVPQQQQQQHYYSFSFVRGVLKVDKGLLYTRAHMSFSRQIEARIIHCTALHCTLRVVYMPMIKGISRMNLLLLANRWMMFFLICWSIHVPTYVHERAYVALGHVMLSRRYVMLSYSLFIDRCCFRCRCYPTIRITN